MTVVLCYTLLILLCVCITVPAVFADISFLSPTCFSRLPSLAYPSSQVCVCLPPYFGDTCSQQHALHLANDISSIEFGYDSNVRIVGDNTAMIYDNQHNFQYDADNDNKVPQLIFHANNVIIPTVTLHTGDVNSNTNNAVNSLVQDNTVHTNVAGHSIDSFLQSLQSLQSSLDSLPYHVT